MHSPTRRQRDTLCISTGPSDTDDWDCYFSGGCRALEQLSVAELETVKTGNAHVKFEQYLCKNLRTSGLANFANAKDCAIKFLEIPGTSELRPSEENAYQVAHGQAMDVQVSMAGVDKELSTIDMKILEAATFDAHTEAFHQTGLKLKDMEVSSAVQTTDNTLVFASAKPDLVESEMVGKSFNIAYYHRAFEFGLCSKLQGSGAHAFAGVHDCSFRFVYNPAQEAATVLALAAPSASE